jgi:hypothetical protein
MFENIAMAFACNVRGGKSFVMNTPFSATSL